MTNTTEDGRGEVNNTRDINTANVSGNKQYPNVHTL